MPPRTKTRPRRRRAKPGSIVVMVIAMILAISGTLMVFSGLMIILKRTAPEVGDWVFEIGGLPWVVLMFAMFFGIVRLFEWMTGSEIRSESARGESKPGDE